MKKTEDPPITLGSVQLGDRFIWRVEEALGPEYAGKSSVPFEGKVLEVIGFEPKFFNSVVLDYGDGEMSLHLEWVEKALSLSPVAGRTNAEAEVRDSDPQQQQTLGEPGTPIRPITNKDDRRFLFRFLQSRPRTWTPEMRLRAYLSIGRPPEPRLLTSSNIRCALSVFDCASMMKLLATEGASLNVSAGLTALAKPLATPAEFALAPIVNALARTVDFWHTRRSAIHLDTVSLKAYLDVLFLVENKLTDVEPGSDRQADADRCRAPLLRLLTFAILETASARNTDLILNLLKCIEFSLMYSLV